MVVGAYGCRLLVGDFNYRIGLGSDKVKQLIKNGDLETLYENDQVSFRTANLMCESR